MKANQTKHKARTGTLFIYDIIAILIAVGANLAISRFNGAALSRDLLIIVLFMTGIQLIVMAFADLLGLAKKFWQGTLFAFLAEVIVVAVEYLMSFGLTPRFLLLTAVTVIVLVTVSHIIWAHRNKKVLAEDAASNDDEEVAVYEPDNDTAETTDESSGDDQKVNWMLRGSVFEDETTADISEAIAQARAEAEAAEADEQEDGDAVEETEESTETDAASDEMQESADEAPEADNDEIETSEDVETDNDATDDIEDEATEPATDEDWEDNAVADEDNGPAFDGLSPVDVAEAPTDIQDDFAEEASVPEADAESAEANETKDSETPEKSDAEDDTAGFAGMTGMFEPVHPEDMADAAETPKKPAIKARPAREDFSEIERALGRFIDDISDSASGDDATFANDTEALRDALSDLNAITADKTIVRCGRKLRKELTFVTKRRHLDDAIIDDLVDLTQMISQHVSKQQAQDKPKTTVTPDEPVEKVPAVQPAKSQPKQAQTTVTANRVPSHKSPVTLADGEIILDSGDSEIIIDAETLEMIKRYTKAHAND